MNPSSRIFDRFTARPSPRCLASIVHPAATLRGVKRTVILKDFYGNLEHVDTDDPIPRFLSWGDATYERTQGILYEQVKVHDARPCDTRRIHDTKRSFRIYELE